MFFGVFFVNFDQTVTPLNFEISTTDFLLSKETLITAFAKYHSWGNKFKIHFHSFELKENCSKVEFQYLLQEFQSVSDHLGTLCIKESNHQPYNRQLLFTHLKRQWGPNNINMNRNIHFGQTSNLAYMEKLNLSRWNSWKSIQKNYFFLLL